MTGSHFPLGSRTRSPWVPNCNSGPTAAARSTPTRGGESNKVPWQSKRGPLVTGLPGHPPLPLPWPSSLRAQFPGGGALGDRTGTALPRFAVPPADHATIQSCTHGKGWGSCQKGRVVRLCLLPKWQGERVRVGGERKRRKGRVGNYPDVTGVHNHLQ
jgi:hypothetical protein